MIVVSSLVCREISDCGELYVLYGEMIVVSSLVYKEVGDCGELSVV